MFWQIDVAVATRVKFIFGRFREWGNPALNGAGREQKPLIVLNFCARSQVIA